MATLIEASRGYFAAAARGPQLNLNSLVTLPFFLQKCEMSDTLSVSLCFCFATR